MRSRLKEHTSCTNSAPCTKARIFSASMHTSIFYHKCCKALHFSAADASFPRRDSICLHTCTPDTPHVWRCIIHGRRLNLWSLRTADGTGSDLCVGIRGWRVLFAPPFCLSGSTLIESPAENIKTSAKHFWRFAAVHKDSQSTAGTDWLSRSKPRLTSPLFRRMVLLGLLPVQLVLSRTVYTYMEFVLLQ